MYEVSAANSETVSNTMNITSHVTRYARRSAARLNEENKYFVSCGLRSSGSVSAVMKSGIQLAAPVVAHKRKMREADCVKREGVRSLMFLSRESKIQIYEGGD